jgi:hypothetical protein
VRPWSEVGAALVYSVVFAWVGFAFVVVHATFGCLVHIFALYLSMKAGKTDLSKKISLKFKPSNTIQLKHDHTNKCQREKLHAV